MFLGACTFIIAYVISCRCPTRHLAQAFHSSTLPAISSERARGAPHAGRTTSRPSLLGRWSWTRRWVGFWLECAATARSARLVLLAAGLLACSALCCASAWFILVTNEAPLLVRVSAGRGQLLCPWDRGDKVVSSCWWVRACFIHPETLFQTLSHIACLDVLHVSKHPC